jgi:rare lipoprotein A
MNRKDPVQFWLLVGASCLALACAVLTIPTRTVQADAVLSRPAAPPPPPSLVMIPTPVVTAPTKVQHKPTEAQHKAAPQLLRGFASWYGSVFDGRLTASGERFNMYEMTACHPTLPFGTRVRVVNTRNHRSVVVRITDRGLLYGRRVIDLSYAAAQQLDMMNSGVVPVTIQVLPPGQS